MSAMQLIERYKVPLLILELLFLVAFAIELYYFSGKGIVQLDHLAAVAILVPALGAWICFFPLCYLAWFRKPSSSTSRRTKFLFFWLLLIGSALIWINMIFLVIDSVD